MTPEQVLGEQKVKGARTLHETRLLNDLKNLEQTRLAQLSFRRRVFTAAAFLSVTGMGYFIWAIYRDMDGISPISIVVAVLAASIGMCLYIFNVDWPQPILSDAKRLLLLPIISKLGFMYEQHPWGFEEVHQAFELGLVKPHDQVYLEDGISGDRSGLSFKLFELQVIKLVKNKNGNCDPVQKFWGQVMAISFPKSFNGITVAARRTDIFNRLRRPKGLANAKLESHSLGKRFKMFTTDQVEARYLMTPDFLERLTQLEEKMHGKRLRFGFSGHQLFIIVQKGRLFDPNPSRTAYDSQKALDDLLQDMANMMELFDTLAAERHRETA